MGQEGRDRLFHRVLKDQKAIQETSTTPLHDERYSALVSTYWKAQQYYATRAVSDPASASARIGSSRETS